MAVVKGQYNQVIENTNNTLIAITEDKLKIIIISHLERAKKQNDWIGLLGILLTIIISLITCKFEDFWNIKNSGIFMCSFFFFVAIVVLFLLIKHLFKANKTSVDLFLSDVRKDNE